MRESGVVEQAIAEIEAAQPLSVVEPKLNGPLTQAITTALRPIGAKIAPTMNDQQAQAWMAGVVLALSDLPAKIALYGVRKAIHRPMAFPNEVDGVAREFAEEALNKQRTALHRLKMMKAEIERALSPQPLIEAPAVEWTEESVAEANATFEKAGIKTRYRLEDGELVVEHPDWKRRKTAEFDTDENDA